MLRTPGENNVRLAFDQRQTSTHYMYMTTFHDHNTSLQVLLQKLGEAKHLRFELNDDVILNNKHDGCREMALCSEGDDGACEPTLPCRLSQILRFCFITCLTFTEQHFLRSI